MNMWLIVIGRYVSTLATTVFLILLLFKPYFEIFYPDLDGQSRKYSVVTVLVFFVGIAMVNVFLFFSPFKDSPKTESVLIIAFYVIGSVFLAFFIPDYSMILLCLLTASAVHWTLTYAVLKLKDKIS